MEEKQRPNVKVMCVFQHNGKTLASKGFDKNKNETFYRLVGGSLEFGETTLDGVKREIKEELGCEIQNLLFVKVIENIFIYEGKPGHDIVFVYRGELANRELYKKEKIHIVEPHGEFDAEWVSVSAILSGKTILYPTLDYREIFKA